MAYSSDTASALFLHALLRSYVETVLDHPTDESAADAGKQGAFRVTVADIPLVRDAMKNGAEQDAKMAFTAYTVACVGGMRLLNLAQNALFEAGGADVLSKFMDELFAQGVAAEAAAAQEMAQEAREDPPDMRSN